MNCRSGNSTISASKLMFECARVRVVIVSCNVLVNVGFACTTPHSVYLSPSAFAKYVLAKGYAAPEFEILALPVANMYAQMS